MKKLAIVLISVLLLLSLVGCGTFSYNIRNYVDIPDVSSISVKQSKIDDQFSESLKNLLSSYKAEDEITTGTVEEGNTTYIYYKGTATVFNGLYSFNVGENAFKGLDEAVKNAEFKDGVAVFDVTLPEDFTVPEEIGREIKAKADAVEAASKPTETPTAETETAEETATGEETLPATDEPANAALADDEDDTVGADPATETTAETETPEDPYKDYNTLLAGKTVTVTLKVDGKNGKVADGETVSAQMKIELVFDKGTYDAESTQEKNKGEDDRKGFALEIGSGSFINGFEDGMIGMSVEKGTKKALDLTFPSPYTSNTALSGMDVVFEVEIQSVTNIHERDLSNAKEFADLKADFEKANGEGSFDYTDKADYEAGVRKNIKASLASEALVNASKVKKWKYSDLDDYKISARNSLLNNYMYYYYQMTGQFLSSEDQVVSTFFSGDYDNYSQTIANQAGKQLKNDWVLYQVAKDQGLDKISDEEYNKFVSEQLAMANAGITDEESKTTEDTLVKNMGGKSAVEKYVALDKAQKWLGENVKVV